MIPKEMRRKIEDKLNLDKEVKEWLESNLDMECCDYETMQIVDKPKGDKQGNGEYCDQFRYGDSEDSYFGRYYYPLDNGKYLCFCFQT